MTEANIDQNFEGLRVAVIGGGIVGLAHAWSAARRGCRVALFEKERVACGASVRNFGMIWPIGQPPGETHEVAIRSRQSWLTLARDAGVWARDCGSIHLAHRDDEWAVLSEFAAAAPRLGYECHLIGPDEVVRMSPGASPVGLIGGLWSPTEVCVNPRTASARIAAWLGESQGVRVEFGAGVRSVESGAVRLADGRTEAADVIVVCGGDETRLMFPELLAEHPVRRCKLQMMRTIPQPGGWAIGPHLASGLTLRHYRNFSICPSLTSLADRVARETPELDRYGIHVMASQDDAGHVIIGDSHEYGAEIEPFDKEEIDRLILREIRKIIRLPEWSIDGRWHGIYLKHAELPALEVSPMPGVYVCTATGGAGMTMSFGLAERFWDRAPEAVRAGVLQ